MWKIKCIISHFDLAANIYKKQTQQPVIKRIIIIDKKKKKKQTFFEPKTLETGILIFLSFPFFLCWEKMIQLRVPREWVQNGGGEIKMEEKGTTLPHLPQGFQLFDQVEAGWGWSACTDTIMYVEQLKYVQERAFMTSINDVHFSNINRKRKRGWKTDYIFAITIQKGRGRKID